MPATLESHQIPSTSDSHSPAWSTESDNTERRSEFSADEVTNPNALSATPLLSEHLVKAIERAAKNEHVDEVNTLTERIVHSGEGASQYDVFILREILDILVDNESIYRTSVARILVALQAAHALDELPIGKLRQIVIYSLTKKVHPEVDIPIFTLITPILTDYVLRLKSDPRLILDKLTSTNATWILFKMMMRLVQCRRYDDVLHTLRVLVDSGVVPTSALEGLDVSSRAFSSIILVILVRCCLHRGWRNRAVALLNSTVEWDTHMPESFGHSIVEALDSLLEDVNRLHVRGAAGLIVRMMGQPHFRVPHSVLQRFYDACRQLSETALAIAVYRVTRSKMVQANHSYPAPNSRALFWLLRFCVETKYIHVMRLILSQVVQESVDLPPHTHSAFLKVAAAHGFMTIAREMWKRALSQGDRVVLADAGVLVRLVSLTQNRIRRHQERLDERPRGRSTLAISSPQAYPMSPVSSVSHASDASPSSLCTFDPPFDNFDPPDLIEDDEDDHQNLSYQEQIAIYRAFADSVIETFVKHRHPLKHATHQELNALARAYILVGKLVDSMRVFKILLNRKEVPDLRDANVALSSVSMSNPSGAAEIINQMVALGLKPDAVTFGTVIHHAIEHGDMDLVSRLIARARKLDIELDYKTVGTLIRACVSNLEDGTAPRVRLQNAKHLIDSLYDAGIVPSPGMGVDCVVAALRADDPVMAHDFWRFIIRDKTQWDDLQQLILRQRIGAVVRQQWLHGSLPTMRARKILSDLGQPPLPPQPRKPRAIGLKKPRLSSDDEAGGA